MIGRSLVFEGYGATVRVDIPDRLDLAALKSFVASELAADMSTQGRPDLLLTCWKGLWRLVMGERRYGPYRTEENACRALSNGIHFLIGKRSPMIFLHAGAVELDGAAVVFPGRSRWGKSTLVSSLVDQGCGYLSDEYAVISAEGMVFPFSKPIRLRSKGNGATYRHPPAVCAPEGFPCTALILTRFEEGKAWRPERVTQGLTVLRTLPSALKSRDAPEIVLKALTALVTEAACYEGTRGGDDLTITVIRELQVVGNRRVEVSS